MPEISVGMKVLFHSDLLTLRFAAIACSTTSEVGKTPGEVSA